MLKFQHHILTIVSLFCSLGIGILIGISMGEDFVISQQEDIISKLENEVYNLYKEQEELSSENNELRQRLSWWEDRGEQIREEISFINAPDILLIGKQDKITKIKQIFEKWNVTELSLLPTSELKSEDSLNIYASDIEPELVIISAAEYEDKVNNVTDETGAKVINLQNSLLDDDLSSIHNQFKLINDIINKSSQAELSKFDPQFIIEE